MINVQPRKKPPKEASQLEEKVLNSIVRRIIRFIMYELIHPMGKYQDAEGDVAKNPDLANWSGKGLMKKTEDGRVMQNELNYI